MLDARLYASHRSTIYDIIISSLLVSMLWSGLWCNAAASDFSSDTANNADDSDEENLMVWDVMIADQLDLTRFIENVTTYTDRRNTTNSIRLSLAGGRQYELDIVKLMKITINGSLIMEKNGSLLAEIKCTTGISDLEELSKTIKPLSRASLVLLDGLTFTGCPVPILIEEASNVVIKNCIFQ